MATPPTGVLLSWNPPSWSYKPCFWAGQLKEKSHFPSNHSNEKGANIKPGAIVFTLPWAPILITNLQTTGLPWHWSGVWKLSRNLWQTGSAWKWLSQHLFPSSPESQERKKAQRVAGETGCPPVVSKSPTAFPKAGLFLFPSSCHASPSPCCGRPIPPSKSSF